MGGRGGSPLPAPRSLTLPRCSWDWQCSLTIPSSPRLTLHTKQVNSLPWWKNPGGKEVWFCWKSIRSTTSSPRVMVATPHSSTSLKPSTLLCCGNACFEISVSVSVAQEMRPRVKLLKILSWTISTTSSGWSKRTKTKQLSLSCLGWQQ